MDKKILLLYISQVSGHHSATLAIEEAIKSLAPRQPVLNINGFNYVYPIGEKLIHYIYMGVIKRAPRIWNMIYDNPKFMKRSEAIKESLNRKNRKKIGKLIEENNCSIVLCSQAFPCGMVADYKKYTNPNIKLFAVITDFTPHSYWVYEEVDYYIVPSEEAKEALMSKGVKPERIKLFGIPIDPKFSKKAGRNTIAKELNISLDKPIVLVMGGGHGLGPIKTLIGRLDNSSSEMKLIVVCGINKKVLRWLKKSKFKKEVISLSYVDNIDKLMDISDLLITKPGGITTAEALAKELPMIIIKPIPGQEMNNTNFLLKYGAAERVFSVEEASSKVSELLSDPKKIELLKTNIKKISKPLSALKTAELALSLNS